MWFLPFNISYSTKEKKPKTLIELPLQRAFCAYCQDRIWGLGRQGFKCTQCKLLVHKKCHKLGSKSCTNEHVEPILKDRDGLNGVGSDHHAQDVVASVPDYPPEISHQGKIQNIILKICK